MTEDEQEARSFRYVMPRCVRLSSGKWAVFIGQNLDQLQIITDWQELHQAIPSTADIEAAEALRRPPKASKLITSINLADLGL